MMYKLGTGTIGELMYECEKKKADESYEISMKILFLARLYTSVSITIMLMFGSLEMGSLIEDGL